MPSSNEKTCARDLLLELFAGTSYLVCADLSKFDMLRSIASVCASKLQLTMICLLKLSLYESNCEGNWPLHIGNQVSKWSNRPRSIYQHSNMAPRLSGQNCKFSKFLLSLNSQKRLEYKGNNTKYTSLTRKPRSHVRILIYRTWPIAWKITTCKYLRAEFKSFD